MYLLSQSQDILLFRAYKQSCVWYFSNVNAVNQHRFCTGCDATGSLTYLTRRVLTDYQPLTLPESVRGPERTGKHITELTHLCGNERAQIPPSQRGREGVYKSLNISFHAKKLHFC